MAYTQKPGSPAKQKTGHGIPSALLQVKNPKTSQLTKKPNLSKSIIAKIEEVSKENKNRVTTERQAVSDSTSVADKLKGTKFQKALAGSNAANVTREKAGFGDMKVSHSRVGSGAGWPIAGTENFSRNQRVETEMPTAIFNPKTSEYTNDPKQSGRRQSKGSGNYIAR